MITGAAAQLLVDCGVELVGVDTPSVDRPPFEAHLALLGDGVLIVENLTNLDAIPGDAFRAGRHAAGNRRPRRLARASVAMCDSRSQRRTEGRRALPSSVMRSRPGYRRHDVAVHVGQAVVAALELEGQPRVVDAQAVQDRGVQVVDVDRIARRCCSE